MSNHGDVLNAFNAMMKSADGSTVLFGTNPLVLSGGTSW